MRPKNYVIFKKNYYGTLRLGNTLYLICDLLLQIR